jgi:hypothetical protein
MNILFWLLDIPAPPDSGDRLADTVAAALTPPLAETARDGRSFNLYLAVALGAALALALYFYWKGSRKKKKERA